MRNTPRAKNGRIGIGRREVEIEDRKTRTLENRKGAAPENQNRSKAGPPVVALVILSFSLDMELLVRNCMEKHYLESPEIPIAALGPICTRLSQVRYPALAGVSANFLSALDNLQFLGFLPHALITQGYREVAAFGFFQSMAKIDDINSKTGEFESWWEQVASRVRSVAETEEAQKKFRKHAWETANRHIGELLKDKDAANALRSLTLARIVFAWTAFECLAGDMWEVAVNEKAIDLGHPAFQHLPQDSIATEGITTRNVAVGILARYGFDLRNALGTVLRPKFDFSSVTGIQTGYEAAFGRVGRLGEILGDKELVRLEITRHAVVHRAGVVDEEYIRRTSSNLSEGQLVPIDGEGVISMLIAMARAACELADFVDRRLCDLASSGPDQPSGPAQRGGASS
jgi:hypothetical protein